MIERNAAMHLCNSFVLNEQRCCLFQITRIETVLTKVSRRAPAVMDAAKDALNEARLGDDVDEQVDQSVVDCGTTQSCRHSASSTSSPCVSDYVTAKQRRSSSCDVDSVTGHMDDVEAAQEAPCRSADDSVASTTTSVPLLQQLVSSPFEVITPVATNPTVTTPSPPLTSDTDAQTSLDRSYLQRLESFVSSVGQVATAPLPHPPLTGWIRRPIFPSRSAAPTTDSVPMHVKRSAPAAAVCPYSLASLFPAPPPTGESSRPLDLSAKRMEFPVPPVVTTRSSQRKCFDSAQRDSSQEAVKGRFVDMVEVQSNGVNSLACLERDFGEHSAILTQLGTAQRQASAALTMTAGAASRRDRSATMFDSTESTHSFARAPICPPGSTPAPYAKFSSARSFATISQYLPTVGGPTGGGKLDSHHSAMTTTTAATALRCLQCGIMFYSLPELTLHMIQSAHYANLICAAAAYRVDDDEDCTVVDSRQTSNTAGSEHSTRRSAAAHLSRGKGLTENSHLRDGLHSDVRSRDYLDSDAVSPARSLDDESVSSAGLTETESLRSPTSTGSPTSPSHDNVGSSDDDLTLMSRLIRLQQLLSRTVLNNIQSAAVSSVGHPDWTAAGLAAVEERRRQLLRGRTSKTTSMRELDHSARVDSSPVDLRSGRMDGGRRRDNNQSRQTTPASKMSALALRSASRDVYLEKLLDNVRGRRTSVSSGVKRSASSKWYNGKHATKKQHRTYSTSTPEFNATRYDAPGVNGSKVCLRNRDDAIHHGCRETASGGLRLSSPATRDPQASRRQEAAADSTHHRSKDGASQPIVIDGDRTDSPAQSVSDRDAEFQQTGRDLRRSSADKEQSEYAARFGKYYRLAQELSNKSD